MKTQVLKLWNTYERHLSALTLIIGFSFDLLLAKRPDSIVDNVLLLFYLVLAAACIVVLHRRSKPQRLEKDAAFEEETSAKPLFLLLVMQFCFGGLASSLLILYGKSGSLGSSLLFIALLTGLLIGNEFLKSKYDQLRFNLAVYYILLLTYLVIAVPTFLLHRIGTTTFLVSGALSLIIMLLFISILFPSVWMFVRRRQQEPGKRLPIPALKLSGLVGIIFLIFNGLYFANIIPPVPLSLKSAGIYHVVERTSDGNYAAAYEQKRWYEFWRDTADDFNIQEGSPAYCFSAVFAPGELSTPIVHRWEYLYSETNTWITTGVVEFPIRGGRAEGYRGYSKKQVLTDGRWRCTVETYSGQVIGRITFTVKTSSSTPELVHGAL